MNCIDLSCPVEIFSTAMPTEEIPAATLTLFNLSDRVIASVEVLLRLLDADGGETERLAFRGRALNGRPHSTFLLTAPCAPSPELKSLEVTVEKVWYSDNDTWRRNPANMVAYTPNALPVSPALTNLKYAAGETAVGYPSLQNGLWVCVCGRPNPETEGYCARCGRQMDMVFSRFSPETVEAQVSMKERQLDLNSRNMREDTIRLQRIREEAYIRKKNRRRTRLRITAAIITAFALTAGVLLFGSPMLRMAAGRKALETGDTAGAKAVFEALGSFGDAESLVAECNWRLAMEAAENSSSAEELANASALLRAISDHPEAIEKANETDLLRSRLLLGSGQWQKALDTLSLIPEGFPGREELELDCRTAQAYALQNNGQYAEAREIWLSLGDAPGAKEQAAACVYQPAMAFMETKDWDGAIQLLSEIPDYSDSREKTLECHYQKAEEKLEAGDLEGASNEFLLADDWADAPERCKSLIYAQAESLYNAGDMKGAQSLYASIPDYQDANQKDLACRYSLAKAAADDLEYSLALDLLRNVPDDYEQAGMLRTEATYQKAKSAIRRNDWAAAAELLGSLDRTSLIRQYRDIESLYLEACENAGIAAYPETPSPETALPETVHPETESTVSPTPVPSGTPTPRTTDPLLSPFLVEDEEEQP